MTMVYCSTCGKDIHISDANKHKSDGHNVVTPMDLRGPVGEDDGR